MRGPGKAARALGIATIAASLVAILIGSVPMSAFASGSAIVGQITNESDLPLAGIHVEACNRLDCSTSVAAVSDADGNFRLDGLQSGSYRISFYDPTLEYAFGYLGFAGYTPANATSVALQVGPGFDSKANVRLPIALRLTGTITGRGGIPLSGIEVMPLGPNVCVDQVGCLRGSSAPDGSFSVRGLPRGEYTIRFLFQLGSMQVASWYAGTAEAGPPAAAETIKLLDHDVRIDARLSADADSCSRPVEPFRGWSLVRYPYMCRDGSSRRALIGGQELDSVVAGGPGFVALGRREFQIGAAPEAAAFTSADGSTWAASHVDPRVHGALAAGHGWLVAVGPGTGGRSADGVVWRSATGPPSPTSSIAGVSGGGAGFAAVGQRSAGGTRASIWTSSDGLRWRQVADQPAFNHFCANAIVGRATGFVAVGTDCHSRFVTAAVVITSRDGRTWHRVPAQSAFAGHSSLTSIVVGGPGLVASGGFTPAGGRWGGGFWTSRDGNSWRRVAYFRSGASRWVFRTTGGFVGVAPGSRTYVSRDGAAWANAYASPMPDNVNGRVWQASGAAAHGSVVVIVGSYSESDDGPSTILASPIEAGGLAWTGAPF